MARGAGRWQRGEGARPGALFDCELCVFTRVFDSLRPLTHRQRQRSNGRKSCDRTCHVLAPLSLSPFRRVTGTQVPCVVLLDATLHHRLAMSSVMKVIMCVASRFQRATSAVRATPPAAHRAPPHNQAPNPPSLLPSTLLRAIQPF